MQGQAEIARERERENELADAYSIQTRCVRLFIIITHSVCACGCDPSTKDEHRQKCVLYGTWNVVKYEQKTHIYTLHL